MSLAYSNGILVPAASATFAADDHGVLYGLGFFETFRTSAGRPFLWPAHRERLDAACARAGITLPADTLARDEARLAETVSQLLQVHAQADAVFRYTVTAGSPDADKTYPRPRELLTLRPQPPPAPEAGIDLCLLRTLRQPPEWLPRPKSLQYANTVLGWQELHLRGGGPQDEGVFLNADGFVVEALWHNLAWIAGGELRHPEPTLGAVAGIALAWALAQGFPVRAVRATWPELLAADAIFICNSVRGLTPVRRARDATGEICAEFPDAHRHPCITELRARWAAELAQTSSVISPT
jgi:4-amino-4-deoxychorismate lyase